MESPHGQLSTRLTNGLGSNNPYRFTHIHAVSARQVTAITHGADTHARITTDRRADAYLVNTHTFDAANPGFVDHGAGGHQNFIAARDRKSTRLNSSHVR